MIAPSLLLALDAALKTTLVLAAAGAAVALARRASAATRHLLWTVALACALLLPLLAPVVPAWHVSLLPSEWLAEAAPVVVEQRTHARSEAPANPPPSAARRSSPRAAAADLTAPHAAAPAGTVQTRARAAVVTGIVWAVWLSGALLVLLPLVFGTVRLAWQARTRTAVGEPWRTLADELGAELGLRGRVALIRGDREAMPMAWGLVRPAVLLPAGAEEWPAARRRAVLTHELAHVKRRDCLTQALAHLACAVYWFHPLAWLAARRMRAERERACDDLVLRAGARRSDYADHLLEMARGLRACRHPALATVAMARPSQLEGRLLAILDPSAERGTPSRPAVTGTVVLAASLLFPLAGVQLWARPTLPLATAVPAQFAAGSSELESAGAGRAPSQPPPDARPSGAGAAAGQTAATPETSGDSFAERADEDRAPVLAGAVEQEGEPAQQPARVVDALMGALDDSDAEVRREAVFALGRLRSARAAAAIAKALRDSDPEVRTQAAFALGQIRDSAAIDALANALAGDAESEVRTQAAFALGQIRADAAVEALARALAKDADGEVRKQAAFALGQVRSPAATAALAAALSDAEAEVRKQAVFALGQVRDTRSVERLAQALADADSEVRSQAAFALGQMRDERAVSGLLTALSDRHADVRQQAAFALGQLRTPQAAGGLAKALADSDADVRKQAIFALGQLRSREAVPALIEALRDKDAEVRGQAAFALGQIGDQRATSALTAALKDADTDVRRQAAFALSQVTR
jgi:HEAT repeat protein/beta-lactamase regulating signal transducer with metallopeptidase domain